MRKSWLGLLLVMGCATVDETDELVAPLVGGDSLVKYTVRLDNCSGILLNPRWILTTAKCIGTPGIQTRHVDYAPSAGAVTSIYIGNVQTFVHPLASTSASPPVFAEHDVGLIYIYERGIDTAGLGITQPALYSDQRLPGHGWSTEVATVQLVGWGAAGTACTDGSNRQRISSPFDLLPGTLSLPYLHSAMAPANPCTRDRGGPLLAQRGGSSLVTSLYADSVGGPGAQSYYTILRTNLDWIEDTLANETSYAYRTGTTDAATSNGYAYVRENVIARSAGPLANLLDGCLERDATTDLVAPRPCSQATTQAWAYTVAGTIQTTEPRPRCLTNFNAQLKVVACDGSSLQRFYVDTANENRVRNALGGLCMHSNGSGVTANLATCQTTNAFFFRFAP